MSCLYYFSINLRVNLYDFLMKEFDREEKKIHRVQILVGESLKKKISEAESLGLDLQKLGRAAIEAKVDEYLEKKKA